MSFCENCVKGVTHEGTPEGTFEFINGVESYIATPSGEYAKEKAIIFCPDIFGPHLINAQLLADDFARNGFKTIIPDYLNGDPVPVEAMEAGEFDLGGWFPQHMADATHPPLFKVIEGLKAQGITTFGATGYCYGARWAWNIAYEGITSVTVVSHPSLLTVPDDFVKYRDTIKAPLLINTCTFDDIFPAASQAKADEVFADFAPGYKRNFYEGCTHGFAVRGDLSDPKVKIGKEGSFSESVQWFKKYL